jgi:hypothetical protein
MIRTVAVKRLLVLALSCAAVSACGGDGESNEGSSDFQRAIEPEAQAQAESMLLQLTDFPDGWRAEEPEEEDEEGDEAFRDCLGVDYSTFTVIGDGQSDDFAMGETTSASSDAEVFESEQMAAEAVARFTQALDGEEADTCMADLLGGLEDENVEITGAEVGELSFTPPPGVDDAKAWQVTVTIEGKAGGQAEGVSVTAYFDLVQLRSGEETAEVTTGDILTPFDPELRDDLVAAVAARMS